MLSTEFPKDYFTCIIFIFASVSGFCQTAQQSFLNNIPLEVYNGFIGDSITIPGNSHAQPVFKVGVYQSNVKINLKDIGEVYVHHVLYDLAGYPFMEVYSRKPSSEFIQGIKRYGNYRMYEHRNYLTDSTYNGKPKIEFVKGLNSIVKSIYPLSIFNISSGRDMQIAGESNDANTVILDVKDCKKYIDPILYDSLKIGNFGPDCIFNGWIQYDLDDEIMKVDLYFGTGEELRMNTFESVIYDTLGNLIGHVEGYGPLNYLNLTANHKYAFTNTGGAVSEDFIAPYVFRIINIETGEIILFRRSVSKELNGWAISHSNLGVFTALNPYGDENVYGESYIIDIDKKLMYPIHLNTLCPPPSHIAFYPTYCECSMPDGLKSTFFYDKDFKSVKFR